MAASTTVLVGGLSDEAFALLGAPANDATEPTVSFVEALSDALGDLGTALLALCVAPVTVAAERSLRAARARRAPVARKAA